MELSFAVRVGRWPLLMLRRQSCAHHSIWSLLVICSLLVASAAPSVHAAPSDPSVMRITPSLSLTKDDGGATVIPGGTVNYTLTYRNTGNANLTGVVISETVPANTTFSGAGSTPTWSCPDGSPAGTVCTFSVGNLAIGVSGAAVFAVTVVNPVPAGTTQLANSATVTATGGTTATGADTTPVSVTPGLSLTKSDNSTTTTPGSTVVYVLTYRNTGNVGLTGVVINETVPANTTFSATASTATWSCPDGSPAGTVCSYTVGSLADTSPHTVNFAVIVANPLPAGTSQLFNSATVTATGGTTATGTDTDTINTSHDLSIIKSDGGTTVAPGGTVPYLLSYANTGNINLVGVVINETVPANTTFNAAASTGTWTCANGSPAGTPCSLTVGNLAGGATGTATFAVTVLNPLPAGATTVSNSASIADSGGNGADTNPGNNTSSDTTPINVTPGLTLAKSDGGATVQPGGTVAYLLTYRNTGNVGLTGVVLSEAVPANTTFDAAGSSTGWSCADGSPAGTVCTLAIGNLAAGASGTATFAVTVVSPAPAGTTQIANSATVSATGGTTATNSDTTPVNVTPDLSIVKSDSGSTATPGATIPYILTYQNTGDVNLTGVVINEAVPANTTFNAAASTAGWTCTDGSPAGTVCSFAVGSLTAGVAGSVTFAVTVLSPVPAGTTQLANSATISDDGANGPDPTPGDNTGTDTTPVQTTPGLSLAKSDSGVTVQPGGTVPYLLTYRNTGNVGLTGVVLSETVPANTTFNAAASTAGWSCANASPAGTTCTLAIGNLAAGASGSATFAVTLVNPAPSGTTQDRQQRNRHRQRRQHRDQHRHHASQRHP